MKNIQHEITPINEDDLFIILNHPKAVLIIPYISIPISN